VDDLIKKSIVPCKKALSDAGLSVEDITDVILVGGMTRMPKVREVVKNFFKKEPFAGVNPDEAVAVGAALQGSIISNKGLMPGSAEREIVLLDVTPLNLGISVVSGELAVIIPAQTSIPCSKTHTFTTVKDFQTQIQTEIYQGNRPIAKDNRLLGSYVLMDIPPAPAGIPKVDVTFSLSANGTINASSRDRASGKQYGITLQMAGGLSDADIERMKKEAERFSEYDNKRQEEMKLFEEIRNFIDKSESTFKGLDKSLHEKFADRITQTQQDYRRLRSMIESGKTQDIASIYKEVTDKAKPLLTDIYNANASKNRTTSN
jgi:molecular chaperone DnaK